MPRRLALLLVALAATGCMGDDADEAAPTAGPTPTDATARVEPPVEHIHALAVNPADGVLVLATHAGIQHLVPPGPRLDRVSAEPFDATALAVGGPNLFLSSGHPQEDRTDLPSNLGILQTADAGRTWESLSLADVAAADVLRVAGPSVFAYDREQQDLLVSRDGGVQWDIRPTPAAFRDLVFDPVDSESLLATAADGLYSSADAGQTWRRAGSVRGFLAWPDAARLYVVAPDGTVRRSPDAARTFRRVGKVDGAPTAVTASTPQELFVAVEGPAVMHSGDGGATWAALWRSETIG